MIREWEEDQTDDSLYIVDMVLKQIAKLDDVNSIEELNGILPGMLDAIGSCVGADQVLLIEREKEEPLSEWLGELEQGNPAVFLGSDQKKIVALPIFARNEWSGYIQIEHPSRPISDRSLRLLTAVGSHLGSLKMNLQMRSVLERKQRQLEQSLNKVEYEKKLQDALCIEYTSLHLCDLLNDKISTIKFGDHYGVSKLEDQVENYEERKEFFSYTARMQFYYDHYLVQESAPDFMKKLGRENLMQILEKQKRAVFRIRVKKNGTGRQYFEVQIVRIPEMEGFHVIMGYRYLDDLMEERERQEEEIRLNHEIINSISKIYETIYRMDLPADFYEEVSAGKEIHHLTGKCGNITKGFEEETRNSVSAEHQEMMRQFLDISTLPERLKQEETISTEYQSLNGRWYLARFIVKKRDENGLVTNVLYVLREIDEQKKQELKYQMKLLETAEEAKRANMAKTDFLKRMSHDLRTPINGIRGMLEMSEHFPEDTGKLRECRRKIMDSSDYLLNLVNSMLEMNKLETGQLLHQEIAFDLLDVVRDFESVIGTQAAEKGVFMQNCGNPIEHMHLIGSPLYVRQILMNIGSNAVKYTPEGGSIQVSCTEIPLSPKKAMFRFTIADTGIGMSKEFQKHIYEAFVQENTALDMAHLGVGLGMSICRQLVEFLQGTIQFESEQGKGTTFVVELPFELNTEREESDEKQMMKQYDLAGKKILLAEDNALNAEITSFILEEAGASVDIAENGRSALERYRDSKMGTYSLILMDIMMPQMNGYEAAKAIRQLDREDAASIPIIAMSANAFQDDMMESKKSGMTLHLAKPIDEKKLLSAVCRYAV